LWDAGYDSARSIALFGKEPFIAKMMSFATWTQALSLWVYTKAAHVNALASQIAMQYGLGFQAPGKNGALVQLGATPPTGIIPDWTSLFGSLDYCTCEWCASVWGPSAYLTDVLHFMEVRPSPVGWTPRSLVAGALKGWYRADAGITFTSGT